MPDLTAYRRSPLSGPEYVALQDAAVHPEGWIKTLTDRMIGLLDPAETTPLEAVLATKLGGWHQAPEMPQLTDAERLLPDNPREYMQLVWAAEMIALMNRDQPGITEVLKAMNTLFSRIDTISEPALFAAGADALRVSLDLYRRTGQKFLLKLIEELRSRLPDVSGLMHSFPFTREYQPEKTENPQEYEYYERMKRLATGCNTAEALSITALLSQFSGSGRDASAPRVGLNALLRYHGMPSGAFAADPYLAGRDPSRASELEAVCAFAESCLDSFSTTGDPIFAARAEMLLVNALPDLLTDQGCRGASPINRLSGDESCRPIPLTHGEILPLLRALYALRRSMWFMKDEGTLCCALPQSGGCVTYLRGIPVRVTAAAKGVWQRRLTLTLECKSPVQANIQIMVPEYAEEAAVHSSMDVQEVPSGAIHTVSGTFRTGDTIVLEYRVSPRAVSGYRGSVSFYAGAELLALPLPGGDAQWRYAVCPDRISMVSEDRLRALVIATDAPGWQQKDGFILPPPQNVRMGDAYELTLLPFAETNGRIAAFPCSAER